MAKKVLFLPGILGSELYEISPIPWLWADRKVWISPVELLGGALLRLDLAADGFSPGPLAGGADIRPGPPLAQFYSPIVTYLRTVGYDVLPLGFDFRESLLATATGIQIAVQRWAGSAPVWIVAHSMGGLSARVLWALMQASGQGGQVQQIICIATPHYGAWEAAFAWWRLARLYRWMQELAGNWGRPLFEVAAAQIDWVLAGWPGLYELMPFRDVGPLATNYPQQAQQLYQQSYYAGRPGANQRVTAARLAAAPGSQNTINGYLPSAIMAGIYGTGTKTALALAPGGNPASLAGYSYTLAGDGTVTVDEGALPGVVQFLGPGTHELLPQMDWVMQRVRLLIG